MLQIPHRPGPLSIGPSFHNFMRSLSHTISYILSIVNLRRTHTHTDNVTCTQARPKPFLSNSESQEETTVKSRHIVVILTNIHSRFSLEDVPGTLPHNSPWISRMFEDSSRGDTIHQTRMIFDRLTTGKTIKRPLTQIQREPEVHNQTNNLPIWIYGGKVSLNIVF